MQCVLWFLECSVFAPSLGQAPPPESAQAPPPDPTSVSQKATIPKPARKSSDSTVPVPTSTPRPSVQKSKYLLSASHFGVRGSVAFQESNARIVSVINLVFITVQISG